MSCLQLLQNPVLPRRKVAEGLGRAGQLDFLQADLPRIPAEVCELIGDGEAAALKIAQIFLAAEAGEALRLLPDLLRGAGQDLGYIRLAGQAAAGLGGIEDNPVNLPPAFCFPEFVLLFPGRDLLDIAGMDGQQKDGHGHSLISSLILGLGGRCAFDHNW